MVKNILSTQFRIQVLSKLAAPSEALARKVEKLECGGSTNLYGGWVAGAKAVGRGGRVILLSDGQANVGPHIDATSLSAHAGKSYETYGVTTTTIGVGTDYDEGIMAGMARTGGGTHYFAHTVISIKEAFSQERYSAESVVLERLTLRHNAITEQLGHFWAGETKNRVLKIDSLSDLAITIRFTEKSSGSRMTYTVPTPTRFGYSEEAKLEAILQSASEAEGDMLEVRDPRSASVMKERLRAIVFKLFSHPSSDTPQVAGVITRLKAGITRLEALERNYEEEDAMVHRKRSMQSSYNLRERAKGFSSFEDESTIVIREAVSSIRADSDPVDLKIDPAALTLAPIDAWITWAAIPLEVTPDAVVVAMEDPRRGFTRSEIEKRTGRRVHPTFAGISAQEIVAFLQTQSR